MKAIESLIPVVLQNPLMLAMGAGGILLMLVLLVFLRGKKGTAPRSASAPTLRGTNLAVKDPADRSDATLRQVQPPASATSTPGDSQARVPKEEFREETEQEMVTSFKGDTGEGIEDIEARLKDDPNNEDLLDWLAFMYYSNGKLEKAVETYHRAVNLNSGNEHQHYYLGNAYYKLKNKARAVEHWETVVSLKPESKLAQNAQERINKVKAEK